MRSSWPSTRRPEPSTWAPTPSSTTSTARSPRWKTAATTATMRWRRPSIRRIAAATSSSAACATSPRAAVRTWRCSRARIDSYVHAIHSFQAFDIGDIDFTDPVQAMHYEHHIEFPYPTHGSTNCESCHVEGTYNVPDQSKSLPGILSASDELTGRDRNIGSRAGICHRSRFASLWRLSPGGADQRGCSRRTDLLQPAHEAGWLPDRSRRGRCQHAHGRHRADHGLLQVSKEPSRATARSCREKGPERPLFFCPLVCSRLRDYFVRCGLMVRSRSALPPGVRPEKVPFVTVGEETDDASCRLQRQTV